MDRRQFITWSVGGAFLLAAPPTARGQAVPATLSPWIRIGGDGRVTLISTALEMGQGTRTGQIQVLAEELDADWAKIDVEMSSEAEPYLLDGALYSGGSETLRKRFDLLRKAGATARAQLIAAAAARWSVTPETCTTELSRVVHRASGRALDYGALAADAARQPPPADPPLKPASERRYIGKPVPTLALADKVNGQARYGIDFRLPGMLFASIRQCPTFGGTLAGVDPAPALAIAGVRQVVTLKDAVAVVADSTWAAFRGVRALEPRWSLPETQTSSADVFPALGRAMEASDAMISPRDGGADRRKTLRESYAKATRKLEATYETAYLAHAPLEPMNATARVTGDKVEIWAPCQSPTWLRDDVVAMTGRPKDQIIVHPLLMGGGFGRRLKGDYAARAVQIAEKVDAPVQLVWTREEDFTHDFYRPAMRATLRAALGEDGLPGGYEAIVATADDRNGAFGPKPYAIEPFAATLGSAKVGIPIGAWRAVDPGMAVFAKESFFDECAHAAGMDPLAWRERLLGDNPRALRVLRAAAKAIGWGERTEPGVGRGLAMLHEWDTLVAHAVEVIVSGQTLRVTRLVAAVDCGIAVNPQQVRAQFEGGGLMALSAALQETMTFTESRADQSNFDSYPVIRMAQAPAIEVILLDSPDAPMGGAGEPPVPGVAPALANAVFAASGKRVRSLPFSAGGWQV